MLTHDLLAWVAPDLPCDNLLPLEAEGMGLTYVPYWYLPCEEGGVHIFWLQEGKGDQRKTEYLVRFSLLLRGQDPQPIRVPASTHRRSQVCSGSDEVAIRRAVHSVGWHPLK